MQNEKIKILLLLALPITLQANTFELSLFHSIYALQCVASNFAKLYYDYQCAITCLKVMKKERELNHLLADIAHDRQKSPDPSWCAQQHIKLSQLKNLMFEHYNKTCLLKLFFHLRIAKQNTI